MKKRNSKIEEIARRNKVVLCPVNITYSERNKYVLSKYTRSIRNKFPRS